MRYNLHLIFYILVASIFLGFVAPDLFTDGMFMDGLMYAAISNNMAEGLGNFWKPFFSNGLFPEFYEHPPLALGLESLWFRIFGDSIFVERFYSLSSFIVVGVFIVLIWKEITGSYKTGWIPLLFWVTVSVVPWACANNMLENTMSVFIILSAWLYIRQHRRFPYLMIILSGLVLSLAFLTKGFVALYIWTIPFFEWMVFRRTSIMTMFLKSMVLVFSTVLSLVLLNLFSPAAAEYLRIYFNLQVVGSIKFEATVNSRLAILGKFFQHIVVPVFIGLLILLIQFAKKKSLRIPVTNLKTALLYMLVVMAGVLPIMISLKQRGYYILTVYPFFAISAGYLLLPIIESLLQELKIRGLRIIAGTTIILALVSVSLTTIHFNNPDRIRRDKELIQDCYTVFSEIGSNQIIHICPDMYIEWSLHGYLARYGNISLDRNTNSVHQYYLIRDECRSLSKDQYQEIDIGLKTYRLFKKR